VLFTIITWLNTKRYLYIGDGELRCGGSGGGRGGSGSGRSWWWVQEK